MEQENVQSAFGKESTKEDTKTNDLTKERKERAKNELPSESTYFVDIDTAW